MSEGTPAKDPTTQHKKREDTADGCRSMAQDDRSRAEESDSDRMRFRLACSAEAWTTRAELLDRLEANRARIHDQLDSLSAAAEGKEEIRNGEGTNAVQQGSAQTEDKTAEEGPGHHAFRQPEPRAEGLRP
jgi:predicted HTH transcriptional regulator